MKLGRPRRRVPAAPSAVPFSAPAPAPASGVPSAEPPPSPEPAITFDGEKADLALQKARFRRLIFETGPEPKEAPGGRVQALEAEIARLAGREHGVGVASGNGAILLGLLALGVRSGFDVLLPACGFVGLANAVVLAGARPVFVDIDATSGTLDPADLERRITDRSRVILAAHGPSALADMRAVRDIADRQGLKVLESAGRRLGCAARGVKAGAVGDLAVFWFHPAKQLGGIGEGGVLVTDEPSLDGRCRLLRNHGEDGDHRFLHHVLGFDCRMDELVAGYLLQELGELAGKLEERRRIARRYDAVLEGHGSLRPLRSADPAEAPRQYLVAAADRPRLVRYLDRRGIGSRWLYPLPLPQQPAFGGPCGAADAFPAASHLAREAVALPCRPGLAEGEVERICRALAAFRG